jgi:hypothetical protein
MSGSSRQTSNGAAKTISRADGTPNETICKLGIMCASMMHPETMRRICKLPDSVTPKHETLLTVEDSVRAAVQVCGNAMLLHVIAEYLPKENQ